MLLTRVLSPLLLLGAALALLAAGDSAPLWLVHVGGLLRNDPDAALRVAAALLAAFAACAALSRRSSRIFAVAGLGLLAFIALATIAAFNRSPLATTLAAAAFLVAALFGLALARRPLATPAYGPSPAWRILGLIAAATVALGLAAAAPMRSAAAVLDRGPSGRRPPNAIDLMPDRWIGRRIESTPLHEHLPQLAAQVAHGTSFVVLYNPRCGHCHDLFRAHFAGRLAHPVIALEIPPPPGDDVLPSDQPADIDCPECVRLALPVGPMWIVTPPTVLRIEDGVVRCVQEPHSSDNCIDVP